MVSAIFRRKMSRGGWPAIRVLRDLLVEDYGSCRPKVEAIIPKNGGRVGAYRSTLDPVQSRSASLFRLAGRSEIAQSNTNQNREENASDKLSIVGDLS